MRITKTPLKPKVVDQIAKMVDDIVTTKDFTLSVDFACDAYALFEEEVSKRSVFKGYWELFMDVRKLYAMYQLGSLTDSFDFYNRIKNFYKYFMFSQLFKQLDKLDPMEATEYFLKMFQPPNQEPKKPKPQPMQQQKQQDQNDDEQEENDEQQQPQQKPTDTHESPSGDSQDQKGLSADEDNLPIDMGEFKKQMPQVEKALESGILDNEDFQSYIKAGAGVNSEQINIGNIVELVRQISGKLTRKELDIFYVARQKELTEKYRRDQVLSSVQFPDNEMSVKDMESHQEVLKILPSQFALDDDEFTRKLAKKELQVRDYQSRKLKKQALYMLIDVSGSMEGGKNVYASGVGLSLVRQATEEGSIYFLRFFDGSPHELHRIATKTEAVKMADVLVKKPYSGGGTNITSAILTAVKDIKNDPVEFEKVEIMVITDGEDNVNLDKKNLEGVKIHSTVIDGQNSGLERISETYTRLKSSDL